MARQNEIMQIEFVRVFRDKTVQLEEWVASSVWGRGSTREYHDDGEDFPATKSLLEWNGVTFRHEGPASAFRLPIC